MKVLAVFYCLPPMLVPAAMCYLKLALGLKHHGVDVEALVIDPRSFAGRIDDSMRKIVPDDLTRHEVWSPETNPFVKLISRFSITHRLAYRFLVPWKREWTYSAARHLRRSDLDGYDLILTCSQPHCNHLLGLRLKEWTGLPWVAYFSDPWTQNPWEYETSAKMAAYNLALEESVLRAADHVLYTSDEMLRLAQSTSALVVDERSGVLPHSYVPAWYELESPPEAIGKKASVSLLHTGHFYGRRTPAPLVRAMVRLAESQSLPSRMVIRSYGLFPESEREAIHEAGLDDVLEVHDAIPYLESLALMRRDDLLLLVDAKLGRMKESVFLPSKLVDYLGSMKPVVAITPLVGATARVVREVGGTVLDVEDEAEIGAFLSDLATGVRPPPTDPDAVARYHYVEVAQQLVGLFSKLT